MVFPTLRIKTVLACSCTKPIYQNLQSPYGAFCLRPYVATTPGWPEGSWCCNPLTGLFVCDVRTHRTQRTAHNPQLQSPYGAFCLRQRLMKTIEIHVIHTLQSPYGAFCLRRIKGRWWPRGRSACVAIPLRGFLFATLKAILLVSTMVNLCCNPLTGLFVCDVKRGSRAIAQQHRLQSPYGAFCLRRFTYFSCW